MASELKPVKVTVFFPSDMDVSADRASWYLENAVRGHWRSFAHDNDPIRGMARASVAVCPLNADTRPAPAATDTGLETVMRRYRGTDWPDHYPWAFLNESDCQGEPGPRWIIEKLCLQSQAEELLAAERAEKISWKEAAIELDKRERRLEADNAALTARIKEWEKADRLVSAALWEKKVEALEAKLAAAEKALKAARPYVEVYRERWPNSCADETLAHIDALLGGDRRPEDESQD
jgi:hypothetical protein